MTVRHLDQYDILIVQQLRADARMSNAELAASVALSESHCLRRVRTLETSGVIKGYLTVINPIALGLPVTALIEIRLDAPNDAHAASFERAVEKRREITGCWRTSGDADYILRGIVPDPPAYERLL